MLDRSTQADPQRRVVGEGTGVQALGPGAGEAAGEDVVTAAAKLLADMEAMGTHIGLDPNQANFPD